MKSFVLRASAVCALSLAMTVGAAASDTAPATVKAPTKPVAPTVAAVPAPSNPAAIATTSVSAGMLTLSGAHLVYRKDAIDIFLTIKNNDPVDEKLSSADTTWKNSGIVVVTKDKDGKETESSLGQGIGGGKTTEFSDDHMWLRIKGAEKPKDSDVVPLTLSFRRSPNAKLAIAAKGSSSKSVMDWLKN